MPYIILDHPQMGENIGAAARGMLNFGLTGLRLIAPRDGWPNERAQAMASGAFEIMPPVQVFETLEGAIADLHYVLATTARSRDMVKPVLSPDSAAREGVTRENSGQKIGIIFGAERTGLLNDALCRASGIICIPTAPNFPALNLGQSVLLMAYEWAKAISAQAGFEELPQRQQIPASQEDLNAFINRLNALLEASDKFYRAPELKPTMQRNIINMFTRADLTQQEIRTLQGILTALTSAQ